jgi:glutamate dehydrogenase/leucine dehydrogenase
MLFGRGGEGAGYEALHVVQDEPSGLRAIIALHSTALGPAAGGIRRKAYASEAEALDDALRLARAMTVKCATAELPAGGAKTVLLDHRGLRPREAYRALGRAIDALGGAYVAGPDVGTGDAEVAWVREATRHANPPGSDTGAATAVGVNHAIRGTLRALDGDGALRGRTVLVQGLGSVGLRLVDLLRAEGAHVLAADVQEGPRQAALALGAQLVPPEEVLRTPCDVLAPCALGGVLTEAVAQGLPARAVCGSANNVLASPGAGALLHARGVAYAPDFVANAGGVIQGIVALRRGLAQAQGEVAHRLAAIGPRVEGLLQDARARGVPPERLAEERAMARVRAAKGAKP